MQDSEEIKFRRDRLPDRREPGVVHKVTIRDQDGPVRVYILASPYEDGRLGEFFIKGDLEARKYEQWATACSILLQAGFPLKDLVRKFGFVRKAPMGMTDDRDVPTAHSIPDLVVRWLGCRFEGMKWTKGGEDEVETVEPNDIPEERAGLDPANSEVWECCYDCGSGI